MNLPEWANWVARDESGSLYAFGNKPRKRYLGNIWAESSIDGLVEEVEESDGTYSNVKWTDEEPTEIKRGLETGGVSVAELRGIMNVKHQTESTPIEKDTFVQMPKEEVIRRIQQAKAHGYDEVPMMEKSKVYNGKTIPENANENDIWFEKGTIDGKQVTIMNRHDGTTFEPIGSTDPDIINEPNHYKGKHGIETIDVIRNFGNDDMVAGFYWSNVIKYMTRYRSKNGLEDLKKARKNLDWLIEHTEG